MTRLQNVFSGITLRGKRLRERLDFDTCVTYALDFGVPILFLLSLVAASLLTLRMAARDADAQTAPTEVQTVAEPTRGQQFPLRSAQGQPTNSVAPAGTE